MESNVSSIFSDHPVNTIEDTEYAVSFDIAMQTPSLKGQPAAPEGTHQWTISTWISSALVETASDIQAHFIKAESFVYILEKKIETFHSVIIRAKKF